MEVSSSVAELVLNARAPCVIRKAKNIPWDCFSLSLKEWCNQFHREIQGEKLEFEKASRTHYSAPQWERYREKIKLTLKEFLEFSEADSIENDTKLDHWFTFSYKDIKELPRSCRKGVDFSFLGFPNLTDVSFWLSSTGAHTPCHYDSYGCNVVVQVYGRKRWLLFPPDAQLTPVRIPYEESSVYCSETFYSPKDLSQFKAVDKNCYQCILEPGDILIVPNKWWHFVESLSTSLNFNTWIPLDIDNNARLDECIVRYIISKITQGSHVNDLNVILNPNEIGQLEEESINLSILNRLHKDITGINSEKGEHSNCYRYQFLNETEVETLANSLKVEWIKILEEKEFYDVITMNNNRYVPKQEKNTEDINLRMKQALINAICNPEIISKIKGNFLKYTSA